MKFRKLMAGLLSAAVLFSLTVTGCGSSIDQDAVAATLDGREISMGVANFMAQHQAAQMDAYMLAYYGEDMWTSDAGDGSTMTESVKEGIMETLQEYYLLDAHQADYDVSLTEEEKSAITAAAKKFIEDNSSSAVKKMGATQESVEEMLRLTTIHNKMKDAIEAGIDTEVSDEECAQKTFSYVSFTKSEDTSTAADDTSTAADDTSADSDTADTADQKAEAEEFLASAKEGDMDALAEEKEYTVSTCSYGAEDLDEEENTTNMDVAVLTAADKLGDGKVGSSLVETDSSYYVIRMDNTDDKDAAETKKESILSERRSDLYDEVVQKYKDDCKWEINEKEWAKVNFDELYTITTAESQTAADDTAAETDAGADADAGTDTGSADNTGAQAD